MQTPANVKKVEIFKFNALAFAMVVVNHTNASTHLFIFKLPFYMSTFAQDIKTSPVTDRRHFHIAVQQKLLFVCSLLFCVLFCSGKDTERTHLEDNSMTVLS